MRPENGNLKLEIGSASARESFKFQVSSLKSALALCQSLVRIPSVNPHGDPGVTVPGEQACAEFVAEFLRGLGAAVELQAVAPRRPNVVARFPSDRPGKPVLFLAPHLDTVSVVGMTIEPFSGEVRDGRLWGRGASDTKGPMAAMLWALHELGERIATLDHEVWFVGLMGEEAGQEGARAFMKALPESAKRDAFALIGEPTECRTVHTTKGATWITARSSGHAVHASRPDQGDNAIYKMADLARCIRDEIAPALKSLSDPVLGSPTISLGTIRGGTKTNIVPDRCVAEIDMRTIPGQDTEATLARLRAACPGIELDFWQSAPLFTDPAHPLIRLLEEKCGATPAGAPWFCDAAVFAAAGIPAVAAGPGSIAQAHTDDEWITVSDIEAGVEFYKTFLRSL